MATRQPRKQRYILLPPCGIAAESFIEVNAHVGLFMQSLRVQARFTLGTTNMRVIDSARDTGLKLVEMTPLGVAQMRRAAPGVRIVEEQFYEVARAPLPRPLSPVRTKSGQPPAPATLHFTCNGRPVAGAEVHAYTNALLEIGVMGHTRADGSVNLRTGARALIEKLVVMPRLGGWPLVLENVQLPRTEPIALRPIDLAVPDALQLAIANAPGGEGDGVRIGIIDTGCGPHPHLALAGGLCTVVGEPAADFADNALQHGSHVAGIIGARGASPQGMRGLAPQAQLFAYRVFPESGFASNYSIAKAIDQAVADGCDLINMSLGSLAAADPATSSAIADARSAGAVVFCAAGNDGINLVCQPAADPRAVAVGAWGRKGSFPPDSLSATRLGRLSRTDRKHFMGSFSNWGSELEFAGPGVGIVSTVPGAAWAVMDGTSMATPAVTGMVARLLSASPRVMSMPRDQARSDEILGLALQAAKPLGFGPEYEGNGWIT
ncbi:MAG: S8 family serine peptidase [Burkholderiaceae bacterium]